MAQATSIPAGTCVTIISACRNEIQHIGAFLESIAAQRMGPLDWEVIIADGMSNDGTRDYIADFCHRNRRFQVIRNPGRIVSTGLNAAIRVASGDIIIRMDAHTHYSPDYCVKCVETLLATGADNVGGPARTKSKGVVPRAVAAAYHSKFSTGGARFHQPDYEGYVDTVTYGCWRKETLERLGMFDESLVRNQDDELNLRLVRGGGKIWQSPAIVSWYSPRPDLHSLFRQYFQYGFWKVAVIRKHGQPGSWRHLVPAAFVAGNALLAVAALMGLILGSKLPLWAFLAVFGSYALANIAASIAAARQGGWDTLPFLPFVFGAYHFSYGSGFLMGLAQPAGKSGTPLPVESVYTKLSR